MRDLGRIMGQLRRTSEELRRELLLAEEINDFKSSVRDMVDPLRPLPPPLKLKPVPPEKTEKSEQALSSSSEIKSSLEVIFSSPSTKSFTKNLASGGNGFLSIISKI